MRRVVILKPKWGTAAVYKVLDNKNVIGKLGHFTNSDLSNIWAEAEYSGMHQELLRLMMNFKLCYQIPGSDGGYIAPQLLTENQPNCEWGTGDNLVTKYTYVFMPKGIITQFIVSVHSMIAADGREVWRSGVILQRDDTRAEVIENYGKREIQIRVTGKHKRDLLTVITYELDKIHATYRRLQFSKLVPCKCLRCRTEESPTFFALETLRKFMADHQDQIQCQLSYQMVEVRSLLDDSGLSRQEGEQREAGSVVFNGPIASIVIQQPKEATIESNSEGRPVMEKRTSISVKSAWANGSFYLVAFLALISVIGYFAGQLPVYSIAIVLVAGSFGVLLVGALQLRQDERLSETGFLDLARMVLKQLPLLGNLLQSEREMDEGH